MISNEYKKSKLESYLYITSLVYILLPLFIFSLTFLNLYIALACSVGLLLSIFYDIKYELSFKQNLGVIKQDYIYIILILIMAFTFTSIFGAGYIGYSTGDQIKNHMIFKTLIDFDWPVIFENEEVKNRFLAYPLGHYLVPAFIYKFFSSNQNHIYEYLYFGIGMTLFWSWFYIFFRKFVFLVIIVFILFGGLDIIGMLFFNIMPEGIQHIEWWDGWTFLQYSSTGTVMSWSSQHAISQWLIPSMMIYRLFYKNTFYGFILLGIGALFWTHLTIVGLIIFFPQLIKLRFFKNLFKDSSLFSIPLGISILLFYLAKDSGSINSGFIWEVWPIFEIWPKVLLFCILEFGIASLIIYSSKFNWIDKEFSLFVITCIILSLIPLYVVGWSNDISMRVSAIPLFILFLFFTSSLISNLIAKNKSIVSVMLIYLLFASFTSLTEISRQLNHIIGNNFFISNLTDVNWERGINRVNKNCFLVTSPKTFNVKQDDHVKIHTMGIYSIVNLKQDNLFTKICIENNIIIRHYGPIATNKITFYRDDKILNEKISFKQSILKIGYINSLWKEQYTGSESSFFYRYLIKK